MSKAIKIKSQDKNSGNVVKLAHVRHENWSDSRKLIRGVNGKPKPLLVNAALALRMAPEWEGVLAFNEFSSEAIAKKKMPWGRRGKGERPLDDHDDQKFAEWLQQRGIPVSTNVAHEALVMVAREKPFHPVRDYLDELEWDGEERIRHFPKRYLGAGPSTYAKAVMRAFFIAAVARIYEPGCKADHVLILEGEQGRRKSSVLAALADPWFTDDIAELGSKDAAMQMQGVWLIEIAELDSMRRSGVSQVKAFVTRREDRFRPPYGRNVVTAPRQCLFVGTTNNDRYLLDDTGNRRFWPIRTGKIDLKAVKRDRDQLWAEAVHLYEEEEPWWLGEEMERRAALEQQKRQMTDPWQDKVAVLLAGRDEVTVSDILHGLGVSTERQERKDEMRIGSIMNAIGGWRRVRRRHKTGQGKVTRIWAYQRDDR